MGVPIRPPTVDTCHLKDLRHVTGDCRGVLGTECIAGRVASTT
jgi:hypothetical protein